MSLLAVALIALALPSRAAAQPALEDAARAARALLQSSPVLAVAAPQAQSAPPGSGSQVIPRFQQKVFPAPAQGACGLKSFTVMDYEERSRDEDFDRARISLMGAVIETTAPGCIRDYGVVQFIRGCVYHVRYDARTGAELERTFDVARRLRGVRVVFSHPGYEVDTNDEDPLYSGSPEVDDRLGLAYVPNFRLRLRPDRASLLADLRAFDLPDQRTFLMDHPEPTAVVFVTDVPDGGVSMTSEDKGRITANNTSLDFRTCLYRLRDVPTSGSPAGEGTAPESGGPIQCFGWASRYTYDIAAQEFVTDAFQGVDPYCSQAPERVPLPGS
ncbi:MAG: hypothetical protein HY926_01325 [Elusimicrobia bacterium]|nr:hypothetical protein [Elusimicrobiota bacterium]